MNYKSEERRSKYIFVSLLLSCSLVGTVCYLWPSETPAAVTFIQYQEEALVIMKQTSQKCESDNCKFMGIINEMDDSITLLQDTAFMVGNSTQNQLNLKKTYQAIHHLRTNLHDLTGGDLDATFEVEIGLFVDQIGAIKDVVLELSQVTVRMAYDAVDIIKYSKLGKKYLDYLKADGPLAMDKLVASGFEGGYHTQITNDSPKAIKQREKVEQNVYKTVQRTYELLKESKNLAFKRLRRTIPNLENISTSLSKAVAQLRSSKNNTGGTAPRALISKIVKQIKAYMHKHIQEFSEDDRKDVQYVIDGEHNVSMKRKIIYQFQDRHTTKKCTLIIFCTRTPHHTQLITLLFHKVEADGALKVWHKSDQENNRHKLWFKLLEQFDSDILNIQHIQAQIMKEDEAFKSRKVNENAVELLRDFRTDLTFTEIVWDKVDIDSMIDESTKFLRASQTSYKMCTAQVEEFKQIIDDTLNKLISNSSDHLKF